MCNVLWLDDEYEHFETFRELAEYRGLKLHPFAIRQKGLEELHLHPTKYDAILLDAKMPEHSANEVASIRGIKDVINAAHELHIPVYISTGQPDLQKDTTFRDSFENVFIKGDATDDFGGDTELFDKMLDDYSKTETAEIKRRFSDVFTALEKMYLDKQGEDILMPILQALCFPENHPDFDAKHNYNQLRIFIEYLFRIFIAAGMLPPDFINKNEVILIESSRFLCGLEPTYISWKREGTILPKYISYPLSHIIQFGNENSHSCSLFAETNNVDYLFASHAYILCEMVKWMYKYLMEHPSVEENKSEWIKFTPKK